MHLMNIILIIITCLSSFFGIAICISIRQKRRKNVQPKIVREYLNKYLEDYKKQQSLEFCLKIKKDKKNSEEFSLTAYILSAIFMISVWASLKIFSKYATMESFLILIVASILIIFALFIIFQFVKKASIDCIILRNDEIELIDSKYEIQKYKLEKINIKYKIITGYKDHKYIDIYFNEDRFTSIEYNIYDFEEYIAFIIFANLLKRGEIDKISDLTDDSIEILKEDFTYSEE